MLDLNEIFDELCLINAASGLEMNLYSIELCLTEEGPMVNALIEGEVEETVNTVELALGVLWQSCKESVSNTNENTDLN